MWTVNFQMFKLVLEKAEEPEIKLPTSVGSLKKQEISKKTILFCLIDYAKAFDCVDHNKLDNQYVVVIQMYNLDLEKAEEQEVKLQTSVGS